MTVLKTDMGLENFYYSYYPTFIIRNRIDKEKFDKNVEYLKAIKRDLQGLEFLIEGALDDINKKHLVSYLRDIIDSILLDISDIIKTGIKKPVDDLNLLINDDYVLFSVYNKYRLSNNANLSKPLVVIVSRSLRNLEFYFLEQLKEDELACYNFKVRKDKIEVYSACIYEDNPIYSDIKKQTQSEACIKKLEMILR